MNKINNEFQRGFKKPENKTHEETEKKSKRRFASLDVATIRKYFSKDKFK